MNVAHENVTMVRAQFVSRSIRQQSYYSQQYLLFKCKSTQPETRSVAASISTCTSHSSSGCAKSFSRNNDSLEEKERGKFI